MVISTSQVFLFFLLLSVYLKIHGAGIVHVAALMCALIAAMRYPRIMSSLPYVALMGILITFQILYSNDFSKDALRYSIYSLTNIFTIFAALTLLAKIVEVRSGRALFIIMLVFIGLAVLEVYGGLKPVFDAIRGLYTSSSSEYDAIDRDIRQYGQIRPVVFTSEPSSLGNFFGAVWLAYTCIVPPTTRNIAKSALLILVAMALFRSPTLFGYLAVAPGLVLVKRDRDTAGYIYLLAVLFGVTFLFPFTWYRRDMLPPGPLYEFFSSGSFFIRQISPLITVQEAMENAPVLGLAAKFHETSQETTSVFLSLLFGGYYTPDQLTQMPPRKFASNALWELIGTFGIGGLFAFLGILRYSLLYFSVRKVDAVILATLILLVNHAGIVLTFSWVPLLLLSYSFMVPKKAQDLQAAHV